MLSCENHLWSKVVRCIEGYCLETTGQPPRVQISLSKLDQQKIVWFWKDVKISFIIVKMKNGDFLVAYSTAVDVLYRLSLAGYEADLQIADEGECEKATTDRVRSMVDYIMRLVNKKISIKLDEEKC